MVDDLDPELLLPPGDLDDSGICVGVSDHVRDAFDREEVRRPLHVQGEPAVAALTVGVDPDLQRQHRSSGLDRPYQSVVLEDRRVDAADELAQVDMRRPHRSDELVQGAGERARIRVLLQPGQVPLRCESDQLGLYAIMQVPFDPAALAFLGADQALAGR